MKTKIIVGDAATWYLVKKYVDGKVGGGIDDVPEELKKYVRVLGSWVDVTEDLASIENKVDKEVGKSLIADTEISRLSGVTNQTLSGLGGEPSANKQDSLAVDGNGVKFPTVDAVNSGLATKPAKTTQVVAGAGLTGGGTLESDRTLNVMSANDGITVNANNIQLNAVDNLESTSSTQPLSANQGKVLNDKKVEKVAGKGLSTEDYTTAEKSKVANVPLNTNTELGFKVDKVEGKGLSTEDYTTAEKSKVANVPLNTNTELAAKVDKVEGKSLVDDTEIYKLAGIEENANDYTHPSTHPASILDVVDVAEGSVNKLLNERGEMKQLPHAALTDKNSEAAVQHVDTTTTKETLAVADKVALWDSVTGKVVLSNALNDIETILASI